MENTIQSARHRHWPRVVAIIAVLAGAWLVHQPVSDWLVRRTVLSEEAPAPEIIKESLESAPDQAAAIRAAWSTGRIQHRTVAINVAGHFLRTHPNDSSLLALVHEGIADPDIGVREVALSTLADAEPLGLPRAVAIQLGDLDPEVQLLGLHYLRQVAPSNGIVSAERMLNQTDRRVAVSALTLLTHWSGKDFGVKMADTIPASNGDGSPGVLSAEANLQLDSKLDAARSWWQEHARAFGVADGDSVRVDSTPLASLPAGDFTVTDLDGRVLRLSDFRHKTVVINFWTTWCTACVGEMPELVAVQSRHPDDVVVLGVALDAVPDEHGHLGGHAEVDARGHDEDSNHPDISKIRAQVARVKDQRKLNYRVALDETGTVSGKYNGGELPTTLIIDPQGQIRRRYVGPRSLPVLEALIAEAHRPALTASVATIGGPVHQ